MKVRIVVDLDVSACDPDDWKGSTGEFQAAAVEAVNNVLYEAQGNGFPHKLEDVVSIMVDGVTLDERPEG